MRFSGVTLALVSTVKPELVSTVAIEKSDRPYRPLRTNVSSGAGAGASD